jgi:CheY-like chemotaxis protein
MSEQLPRVLLVDDYPDALETWRLYLEISGFEVLTAGDGQSALDLAHAAHPDVIVMDLELPVLSGVDATAQLKRAEDTRHIPVIAATGYSHFNEMDQSKLQLFDVIVVKPCDPAQLLVHIQRLLDARDADDQDAFGSTGQSNAHNGHRGAL